VSFSPSPLGAMTSTFPLLFTRSKGRRRMLKTASSDTFSSELRTTPWVDARTCDETALPEFTPGRAPSPFPL